MYRERLTITLDAELLKAIDGLIDKETLRNRSQTIEHLLKEGIGLHELTQAFIFVEAGFEHSRLEVITQSLINTGINQIFLCLPSDLLSQSTELMALIEQSGVTVTLVPADFGSGGALLLKKEMLSTPFALAWIEGTTPIPETVGPAYLFHRAHHGLLTLLLHFEESIESIFSGIAIASPELLSRIPAGIADLRNDVFPEIAKEGRVKGYLYTN